MSCTCRACCVKTGKALAPASVIKINHYGYWKRGKHSYTSVGVTYLSLFVIVLLLSYGFAEIRTFGQKNGLLDFVIKTNEFLEAKKPSALKEFFGYPDNLYGDLIPSTINDMEPGSGLDSIEEEVGLFDI